ncbi:MBL fold metallo-hydrolase [Pseudomonas sp. N040]|uniref:MBL fold metallo-hydrolase n=1 Tax=Pseudomonas sp. N040 TaxID=2785325 RepID=UPI0018A2ED7A|nr:MBL fold metallo-hydrolase [Pseudomonas sp. N040]MBF7730944.1 MBL fold metallo-hydrolase [Pseudomonas sp. N040]MBW7014587.1 MBL fold metallo-hydrolase [Pseudomonas sp. N040]
MPSSARPAWKINLDSFLGRGAPGHQGPATAHFDGKQFHNIEPKPHKNLWSLLKWQFSRAPQPAWIEQPGPAEPPVLAERVAGSELHVTYINHATLLLQLHGLNILTDPVWSQRVSPFQFIGPRRHHPPGLSLDQLPAIDLILVSHNHYDHLDLDSLAQLAERFPQARVVTGLGNAALIAESGFTRINELDWWQSLPLDDQLTLHAVPVQHWSARSRADTNQTLWLGFVLESPDGPVLFPGDSGLGPEFRLINQRFGAMRFAALPIGAYAPRWFMRDNHMDPDDAVQAHQQLQSQCSMAIHFGTFRLSDEGQFAPPMALQHALQDRHVAHHEFRAPQPGEHWRVAPLARPAG